MNDKNSNKKTSRNESYNDKHKYNFPSSKAINQISKILIKQIDEEMFEKKYAKVSDVLRLVGVGLFFGASAVFPNLPKTISPFLKINQDEYEVWKRFNIPYLKRSLERLEKQKLVEIDEQRGKQIVRITEAGKIKILKFALDELTVGKPRLWDGYWWLISYDLPKGYETQRDFFRDYLKAWSFYPLHESVFLHAYPYNKQVEFLRDYLGVGEYVRIFKVSEIENDHLFREFFGV